MRLYCLWRYKRARVRLRLIYREWSKINCPSYCSFKLLKAEQKVFYWRKRLQDLSH